MTTQITSQTDLVRGTLEAQQAPSGGEPGRLTLALPRTDYRIQLRIKSEVAPDRYNQIAGRIHARAKRVDIVRSGGRYIEPVYGRPRRIQGRVVAHGVEDRTITVLCACPVICELSREEQQPGDFPIGCMVSFDVESGARFDPVDADLTMAPGTRRIEDLSKTTPTGQSPEGEQDKPGDKTKDEGALNEAYIATGQKAPAGDTPISGDASKR